MKMGMDVNVYIGPFFECLPSEMEKEVSYNSCLTATCSNHGKEYVSKPFCNLCGNKLEPFTKKVKSQIDSYDDALKEIRKNMTEVYSGMREDELKPATKHIWVSNLRSKGRRTGCDPEHDVFLEYIQSTQLDRELAEFRVSFSEELKLLKEVYGADNVKVTWGYFNYFS